VVALKKEAMLPEGLSVFSSLSFSPFLQAISRKHNKTNPNPDLNIAGYLKLNKTKINKL
jgi:hypothetical protein